MPEPDWNLMQRLWQEMLQELKGVRAELKELRQEHGLFGPSAGLVRDVEELRAQVKSLHETNAEQHHNLHERLAKLEAGE